MATKLTLWLDDAVIKKAKKMACKKGVSLSRIVEDYFNAIASQERLEGTESPVLYEIAGVLSGKHSISKKQAEYGKHLAEKYR